MMSLEYTFASLDVSQADSEGRLGVCSGLLNTSDDSDSKRAKLSYGNRGLYSRPTSTSLTAAAYSSNAPIGGRGN